MTTWMAQRDRTRTALYRFFDARGTLLYLGITHDVDQRWTSHARFQPWWLDVAKKTVEWHDTRPAAKALEDKAMQQEKPLYDRSGRLRGEVEQGQLVDARLVLETNRALAAIRRAIDDGTFPAWRIMPTISGLSERFELPLVAVSEALDVLERQEGRIARFGDRFAPRGAGEPPTAADRQHGGIYFLATRVFGPQPFTLSEFVAATGYSRSTTEHHLRKLKKGQQVEYVSGASDGESRWRIRC